VRDFEFLAPVGLKEATLLLMKYGGKAAVKAGGIDLLDLMKEGIAQPPSLLNILPLAELRTIKDDPAEGLTIGPLATLNEVATHPAIVKRYPVLAAAVGEAATPQIRNVATLGGNLCQRPRCWYFRSSDFNCLKKGGDTCFAVDGDNRYHAVFGDGPCHIVSASSAGLALVALGAGIETLDHDGGRVLAAEQFYSMPDVDVGRETVLKQGEIITQIRILPPPPGTVSSYIEFREKESFDWALAAAAVILVKEKSGAVRSARIVLGAAAPVPWRAQAAEAVLVGKKIDESSAQRAADAAVQGAKPMTGNAYKVTLLREIVKRAILKAS
jgi:xanthine dehydrogenase YagS FAD-binding subunit